MSEIDFVLEEQGSLFLCRPMNDRAREHLEQNAQEDAQWFGGALVGEPRYALPLAMALNREGWLVRIA